MTIIRGSIDQCMLMNTVLYWSCHHIEGIKTICIMIEFKATSIPMPMLVSLGHTKPNTSFSTYLWTKWRFHSSLYWSTRARLWNPLRSMYITCDSTILLRESQITFDGEMTIGASRNFKPHILAIIPFLPPLFLWVKIREAPYLFMSKHRIWFEINIVFFAFGISWCAGNELKPYCSGIPEDFHQYPHCNFSWVYAYDDCCSCCTILQS